MYQTLLTGRPKGYRGNSIYKTDCAIKVRLAVITYAVDIYFPTNKERPHRNKELAKCDEIDALIAYAQPFMLDPDTKKTLGQFSVSIHKHLKDRHDWFNFEGLIAFKLLSAIDASTKNERFLDLPSFTEIPERVGRLKERPLSKKRMSETIDEAEPAHKQRKIAATTSITTLPTDPTLEAMQEITNELFHQNALLSTIETNLAILQAWRADISSSHQTLLNANDALTQAILARPHPEPETTSNITPSAISISTSTSPRFFSASPEQNNPRFDADAVNPTQQETYSSYDPMEYFK